MRTVAYLAAGVGAFALLVATPMGVAAATALLADEPVGAVLFGLPLVLELTTASLWVVLFAALQLDLTRRWTRRPLLRSSAVVGIALAAGTLGFYRSESVFDRLFFSALYSVLVLLAWLLFEFILSWLRPEEPLTPDRAPWP